MDLDIRQYLNQAKEQQGLCNSSGLMAAGRSCMCSLWVFPVDSGALQSAYHLIKDMTGAGGSGGSPRSAPELYVICAEVALQVRLEASMVQYKALLKADFVRVQTAGL